MNAVEWNRDLTQPLDEIRDREALKLDYLEPAPQRWQAMQRSRDRGVNPSAAFGRCVLSTL